MADSLGTGAVTYTDEHPIVHFGSPVGTQWVPATPSPVVTPRIL